MFKDRNFNIAFSVSILWHLFWMCLVFVVILPKAKDFAKFPTISFLGPILEREIIVEAAKQQEGPKRFYASFKRDFQASDIFGPEIEVAENFEPKESYEINIPMDKIFVEEEEEFKSKSESDIIKYDFGKVVEEGPLSKRRIISKGELPDYHKLAEQNLQGFNMKFKLWVSKEGRVVKVERLASSGLPETDVLGMNYILQWRFEEGDRTSGQAEWGIAEVDFR